MKAAAGIADSVLMIGLDTNVLVRYITQDDLGQAKAASRIMGSLSAEAPGFVSLIVVTELIWVLEGSYNFSRKDLDQVLQALLLSKELIIERTDSVVHALRIFRSSRADFADCLIERCCHSNGCEYTVTFDRRAATGAGMRLIG